jgi:hypothetical protein
VSGISISSRFAETHAPGADPAPFHDDRDCVKSWGRRGIFLGANFGFVLGVIFVAIPFATDVLTFGVFGTLLAGAVECAVIAGGFAALAAALIDKGARHGGAAQFERILIAGRRFTSASRRDGDVPLADWPSRWAYPVQIDNPLHLQASSFTDVQARLGTIDAWENGNTGP